MIVRSLSNILFAFEIVKKLDGALVSPITLESWKVIIILIIRRGVL